MFVNFISSCVEILGTINIGRNDPSSRCSCLLGEILV